MAGRPPKLKNQKTGAYSKKELKIQEESLPVYQSQEFIPPETLTDKQLVVWKELVKIFRDTYNCMVSDADLYIMELYCRARVACDEAEEELRKDNRPYILVPLGVDKNGKPKTTAKPNPNIKKRNENILLVLKYSNELGLTPQGRARTGIKGANAKREENIFKELLGRTDD